MSHWLRFNTLLLLLFILQENLLRHDPTPSNVYPFPKWFTVNQLQEREYGRLLVSFMFDLITMPIILFVDYRNPAIQEGAGHFVQSLIPIGLDLTHIRPCFSSRDLNFVKDLKNTVVSCLLVILSPYDVTIVIFRMCQLFEFQFFWRLALLR